MHEYAILALLVLVCLWEIRMNTRDLLKDLRRSDSHR